MAGRSGPGSRTKRAWFGVVVALCGAIGGGGAGASQLVIGARATSFRAFSPIRLFDTRSGSGGVPAAPIGPGKSLDFGLEGVFGAGFSSTVASVALNVTEVGGTAPSFLTVWPTGSPRPTASSLNWADAGAHPNAVTVQLGDGGKISFFNNGGTVDVIVDIVGYTQIADGFNTGAAPAVQLVAADGSGGTKLIAPSFAPAMPGIVPVLAGATPDDSGRALHDAVAAHPNGHVVFVLEPSAYALASTLTLPPSTTIRGAGTQTEIRSTAATGIDVPTGSLELVDVGLNVTPSAAAPWTGLRMDQGRATLQSARVTVDATGSGQATGISIVGVISSLEARSSSVLASTSGGSATGISLATAERIELHDTGVQASTGTGTAIAFATSSGGADLLDSRLLAIGSTSYAVQLTSNSSVLVQGGQLSGGTAAVDAHSGATRLTGTGLGGHVVLSGGAAATCSYAFNASTYAALTGCG